jgi:dCMP deaminase
MNRPSWQDYFMSVVDAISQRSTCDRGKPGCVFVKNNQILVTGYAGSPPGFDHCDEAGHDMEAHIRFKEWDITKDERPAQDELSKIYELGFRFNEGESRYEKSESVHCIRTIHAEQNAILQAARRGISLEGSTCSMFLISVGVVEVVAKKLYQKAQESIEILKKANIKLTHLEDQQQKY